MSFPRATLVLLVGLCARPVLADGGGWHLDASSYEWLAQTQTRVDTSLGTVSIALDAREALDALDVGVMLGVFAHRGPWFVLGDFFYLDLSFRERTPFGKRFSSVDSRTRLTSLPAYGLYRVYRRYRRGLAPTVQ